MARSNSVQIRTSIWNDNEFTALSPAAQLLWFQMKSRSRPVKFRPGVYATAWGQSVEVVECAASQLRATAYGAVFDSKRRVQTVPDALRWEVFAADSYRCCECGSPDDLTIDHIYPVSRGGTDARENLQTLCRPCNCRKGARV